MTNFTLKKSKMAASRPFLFLNIFFLNIRQIYTAMSANDHINFWEQTILK